MEQYWIWILIYTFMSGATFGVFAIDEQAQQVNPAIVLLVSLIIGALWPAIIVIFTVWYLRGGLRKND